MPSITDSSKINVSILLPTYNEHDNLPIVTWLIATELARSPWIANWELIIVDDGSPDGTGAIADSLADPKRTGGYLLRPGQVRVLKRPGKMGLGSAYAHGSQHATHPYIAVMDADLSHHPKYLSEMARLMVEATTGNAPPPDIVTGSRYIPGGGVHGWDLVRRITSRGANLLADWLLDPRVSDLTGSFRLYRREVFVQLVRETKGKGYTFQMEIMVRARARGLRVVETPITFVDRQFGASKLGGAEIVGYLQGLWLLFTTV